MSTQHTVNVEKNADTLLDTIGRLFARNQSLQKGHATLTRRVQELEAELASAQRALTGNAFGQQKPLSDRAVDAIIADVMKPEQPITAADVRLQADINHLHTRLQHVEQRLPTQKEIGTAVHDTVERMLQPGGLLYRSQK